VQSYTIFTNQQKQNEEYFFPHFHTSLSINGQSTMFLFSELLPFFMKIQPISMKIFIRSKRKSPQMLL